MEYGLGDLSRYNRFRQKHNKIWLESELEEIREQITQQILLLRKYEIVHRDICITFLECWGNEKINMI